MPASARLVAVAAHGLAGSRTDLPAAALSEAEWLELAQGCVAADLIGLLAAAVASGHMPVTAGQAEELAVIEAERAGLSLLVERRAVTMAGVLAAAGIEHRVVDGPARRLAYGDAALRQFGEVQVLVAPDRYDAARSLQGPLPSAVGARPVQRHERLVLRSGVAGLGPVPGEGRDPRPARTDELAAVPAEVDALHLLGPATTLDLAGRPVSVLSLEQQLVVACVEASAHPSPSLALIRDVAQISLCADLDGTAARRLAEAAGVATALAEGIAAAWDRFDLADKTELSVWALRRSGVRHGRPVPRRSTPPLARAGLAQRVLGRRQPVPAGAAGTPSLSPTTAPPSGPGRSTRSTRR
jgi:hypothetical protein